MSLRTTISYDTFNGLNKSLIIKGYKDSTAEFYDKNYEFVFVEIKDTPSIPGDINGDDAVNILDLIGFKKLFAGNTESIEYSAHPDVSGDKIIDTPDLSALRKKFSHKNIHIKTRFRNSYTFGGALCISKICQKAKNSKSSV